MKKLTTVIAAQTTEEGAGFIVHRPFPVPGLSHLDPFLLIDEMGPVNYRPGEAVGAPDHPHRGFETVTYMLEGEFEHQDSQGGTGRLKAGDVQWMTAGRGVVHSEMPSTKIQAEGGRVHGFQIWVNLARKDKMTEPRYQEIASAAIPEIESAGGVVRVVAGDLYDVKAPVETRSPTVYLDVKLKPQGTLLLPVPAELTTLAYVFEGNVSFGHDPRPVNQHELAVFDREGTGIEARGGEAGGRFLLLAGKPLNEPVARYGPFVMNSRAELEQAFEDYQAGRLGKIG